MSIGLRNALIGFGVVFIVSFLLGLAGIRGFLGIMPALLLGGFTWYGLSNLAENRSVTKVPDAERDQALTTPAPSERGLVYVYRDGFRGKALGFDVVLDMVTVAQLKSPRFARLVVAPGEHTLTAGPKGFAWSQNKAGSIAFTIAPGETLIFSLAVEGGMTQNTILIQREPDTKQALGKLALSTMVASTQPHT